MAETYMYPREFETIHSTPHLNFMCSYFTLQKLATIFTTYYTASNIPDTALHCPRPVATEIVPTRVQLTTPCPRKKKPL